jgi:O-antigen/teichoic acid export membrane protein
MKSYIGLPKSSFFRKASTLLIGSVVGQGILFLVSPIISRIYSPADFGVLASFTALIGLFGVFACGRYELAIPIPRDQSQALALALIAIIFAFFSALIFFTVLNVHFYANFNFLTQYKINFYRYVAPLSMFFYSLYQIFSYWSIRKGAMRQIAQTKIYQGVGSAAAQIVFGYAGFGYLGLVSSDFLSRTLGIFSLSKIFWDDFKIENKINLRSILIPTALSYKNFPMYSSFSGLINNLGLQMPLFLIGSYYGINFLGQFAIVQRLIVGGLGIIEQNIGQALYSELSNSGISKKLVLKIVKSVSSKLFLFGFFILLPIIFILSINFTFFFGEKWVFAPKIILFLMPFFLLDFIATPISQVFIFMKRPDVQIRWDFFRLIMVFLAFYLANQISKDVFYAIAFYSAASSISYFVLIISIFLFLRNNE